MGADDILFDLEFERGMDCDGEMLREYRECNGAYRLGNIEADPEMDHFDEMVDLARSLKRSW